MFLWNLQSDSDSDMIHIDTLAWRNIPNQASKETTTKPHPEPI